MTKVFENITAAFSEMARIVKLVGKLVWPLDKACIK